ncbi:MAG: hypothetical protein OXH99_08130 [Bryobacterales bacterium]|nr:hypothetical protein [Bryobacterales bacterium]
MQSFLARVQANCQRGCSEPSRELILGLLASARSIDSVRRSLRRTGVSAPAADLRQVVDTCFGSHSLGEKRLYFLTLAAICCTPFSNESEESHRLAAKQSGNCSSKESEKQQ